MNESKAIPGQLPVPRGRTESTSGGRPKNIPASEWPDAAEEAARLTKRLPSRVVPEARFDAKGNELPRYRATEPCHRQDLPMGRHLDTGEPMYGDRYVETDQEFYHDGPPAYYMEPVNQAAFDMVMAHPPEHYDDPVEALPL